MHKVGWELLKLRFEKKIVEAELYRNREVSFVISFTGRYDNLKEERRGRVERSVLSRCVISHVLLLLLLLLVSVLVIME